MQLPLRWASRSILAAGLLVLSASAWAQGDIRQLVRPASPPANESVIDLAGVVYGLPFGATEDEVMRKFGKPIGYLRVDLHRTALVYGKSCLLLCYDGKFDALRINQAAVDWELAKFIREEPPFISERWELSNGVHSDTNRTKLREITRGEGDADGYAFTFSTDQCRVKINMSHVANEGDGDEAYHAYGLLMASKHDDDDRWADPSRLGRSTLGSLKGKKLLGLNLVDSPKGIRIVGVVKGSPAEQAGIKPGDLITALDGNSVAGERAAAFRDRISGETKPALEITGGYGNKRTLSLEPVDGSTLGGEMVGGVLSLSEVKGGDDAPDFEARAVDDRTIKLSELRGSPVLVNFTATWCGPCKVETPNLVAASSKYRERGLKVISVYLDRRDKDVFAYAKALGADWPISTDGQIFDNAVARAYGVHAIPMNVLIGPDGKIATADLRGERLDPALAKAVEGR